jgi:hypothetical protein
MLRERQKTANSQGQFLMALMAVAATFFRARQRVSNTMDSSRTLRKRRRRDIKNRLYIFGLGILELRAEERVE